MALNELVSIILPTFNGHKYLPQLLESLISQTHKNLEIIVLDDCSQDNTVKIVEQYTLIDNRIKVIVNEKNIGINKNFEKGVKLARGEYIFLCDQDDIWDKNKVKKMTDMLKKGYHLVYCDLRVIDSEGNIISTSFHKTIGTNNLYSKSLAKYLLFRNVTNGCSLCFRRKIINEICPFPDFIIYDWWIMIKATINYKIGYIQAPLMSYRIHDKNAIGFKVVQKTHEDKILEIKKAIYRVNNLDFYVNNKYLINKLNVIRSYYESRQKFYNKDTKLIRHYYIIIKTLFNFPLLYKNLIKDLTEDFMPKVNHFILKVWLGLRMKKNE